MRARCARLGGPPTCSTQPGPRPPRGTWLRAQARCREHESPCEAPGQPRVRSRAAGRNRDAGTGPGRAGRAQDAPGRRREYTPRLWFPRVRRGRPHLRHAGADDEPADHTRLRRPRAPDADTGQTARTGTRPAAPDAGPGSRPADHTRLHTLQEAVDPGRGHRTAARARHPPPQTRAGPASPNPTQAAAGRPPPDAGASAHPGCGPHGPDADEYTHGAQARTTSRADQRGCEGHGPRTRTPGPAPTAYAATTPAAPDAGTEPASAGHTQAPFPLGAPGRTHGTNPRTRSRYRVPREVQGGRTGWCPRSGRAACSWAGARHPSSGAPRDRRVSARWSRAGPCAGRGPRRGPGRSCG